MANKRDLAKLGVIDLHAAIEALNEKMFAIQQQRDKLHAEAMELHTERVPLEEELDRRARTMGLTVPRMVLNAREAATAGADAPDAGA